MKKLLLFGLLLTSLAGIGQTYPSPIFSKPNNSYGNHNNRVAFDSTFYFPTACGIPTDTTFLLSQGTNTTYPGYGQKLMMAALYYDSCGHHEYIWDPSLQAWHVADSIGGPGTTYTADETTIHLAGTVFGIKTTYPGQTSITTVGTITSGIWNSTAIGDSYIASAANWNAKLGSTLNSAQIFIGNGSNVATGVSMSGDGSLNNTGAFTLGNSGVSGSTCTNCNLTYDSKGRITAAANGTGGGSGNPFADNTALVKNNADNTRLLILSAASIATGTTRTATFPNANITVADQLSPLSQFASTTSAQLAGVLSDETGTGVAVFSNAPALTSPTMTTQTTGDNSTKGANTAFVDASIAAIPPVTFTLKRGLMSAGYLTAGLGNPNPFDSTVYLNLGNHASTINAKMIFDSIGNGMIFNGLNPGITGGSIMWRNPDSSLSQLALGTNLSVTAGVLNAAGGGGSPGGSNTQVQFNNSGAFGGSSGLTWASSVLTATGLTVTNDALIHGFAFGMGAQSVAHNTVAGYHAGALATGDYNVFIGYDAATNNVAGPQLVVIGGLACLNSAKIGYGTYIGYGAGEQTDSALYVTAVGLQAATNNQANDVSAGGAYSLFSNTTGYGNTGWGKWSFYTNTTGQHNSGFGLGAGSGCQTGSENTYLGYLSGDLPLGASSYNTAVGSYSLQQAPNPMNNTVMGWAAAMQNTTVSDTASIELGSAAFGVIGTTHYRKNTIGIGNMIGYPLNTISGSDAIWQHCILLGDSLTNQTGTQYFYNTYAIGHNLVVSQSNAFYLGDSTMYFILGNGGVNTAHMNAMANVAGSLVYNYQTGQLNFNNGSSWTALASGGGGGFTTVGTYDGGTAAATGLNYSGTTVFAQSASATNPGMIKASGAQTLGATLTINHDITVNGLTFGLAGNQSATHSTIAGNGASHVTATGDYNTYYGFDDGYNTTSGFQNSVYGAFGAINITTASGLCSFGYHTLYDATTAANATVMGSTSFQTITTATNETGFGTAIFPNLIDGNFNTAVGSTVESANLHGSANTAFGYGVLGSSLGSKNAAFGYNNGASLTGGEGNDILMGYGVDLTAGSNGWINIGRLFFAEGRDSTTGGGTAVGAGTIGLAALPTSTAAVTLPAGTTTIAPLTITPSSAVVLTTPVNGALENNGSHLYVTEGGTRYQLDQQTASTSPFFVSTANGSAYTNSTATTALGGTGTGTGGGTTTVPTGSLTAGRVIHLHGSFVYSTGATNTNFSMLTSGVVSGISIAMPATQTNAVCIWDVDITILTTGSSGTCVFTGTLTFPGQITNSSIILENSTGTTTSTINTTTGEDFQPYGVWTTASSSNSIQSTAGYTIKVQ